MDRRAFSARAIGLAGSVVAPTTLLAQAPVEPRDGRDFVRVSPPLPGPSGGRIDVIEFFWYGCPHCAAFEPTLAAWQRRQPPAVVLRRVPVAFRETPYVAHQRLFYALEAMGRLQDMHALVFETIHRDRLRLDTPAAIADFAAAQGLDMASFLQAYGSFAVQTKAAQATRLALAYSVDGVPSFGVQGIFYTSGTLAGSPERALDVTDALIGKIQRGA